MPDLKDLYQCQGITCGFIYNPDKGDKKSQTPKGTKFDELPDDWKCPSCGAGKKFFKPMG